MEEDADDEGDVSQTIKDQDEYPFPLISAGWKYGRNPINWLWGILCVDPC